MDVVVDANIVIAALISPTGHTSDLFFSPLLRIYAPEFLIEEINKHKNELLEKTGLSESNFTEALSFLSKRIILLPAGELLCTKMAPSHF